MSAAHEHVDELMVKLDEYGFVVVEDLLPAEVFQHLAESIGRVFDERVSAEDPNQHIRGLLEHLATKDLQAVETALLHPTCIALAERVLGTDFQLAEVGSRRFQPGAKGLPLHVGVPADRFNHQGLQPPAQCLVLTFSWLLHDVTRRNGSRVFVPFSHHARRDPRPNANYDHLAHVEARAGSIILFNSAVWHGVQTNVTADEPRIELASAYIVPWIDQRELGWQAPSHSVLQQMSPRMRQLNCQVMEP